MNMTVEEILNQTKALIQTKRAEFKKSASDIDVTDNIPGSVGRMGALPEEYKRPTPKAREDEIDRNVDEEYGRSTAGAGDHEIGRQHALESDEAAEDYDIEAAISGDIKEASGTLANDLLRAIRGYQRTNVKRAAPRNSGGMELNEGILAKLASEILAEEEGRELAQAVMYKAAGAQAARELIGDTLTKEAEAGYHQGAQAARGLIEGVLVKEAEAHTAAGYHQGASDAAALVKQAEYVAQVKLAQDLEDLADLEEASDDLEDFDPELLDALADELGDGGEVDAGVLEDLLVALVEEGELDVEDLEDIVVELIDAELDTEDGSDLDVLDDFDDEDLAKLGQALADEMLDDVVDDDDDDDILADIEDASADDVDIEDVIDAIDELVASDAIDEAEAEQLIEYIADASEGGEGGDDMSIEDLADAVDQLVAADVIDEEDAEAVMDSLME